MSDDIVQVNWESQKRVLFSNLSILRRKEIHTDVTLSCEGEYFPVHRLILTMGCGYFAKTFENAKNPSFSLILICGIRASILEALLNFIYDGTTTLKREDMGDLSKAGAMLEVPGLMDLGKQMVLLNNSMKSSSALAPEMSPRKISSSSKNSSSFAPEMSPRKISSSSKNINNNKTNIVSPQPANKEVNDVNQVVKENGSPEENGKSESMKEENNSEEIETSRSIESLFDSDSCDSENFEGWEQTPIDDSKPKFCLKQGSTKRKRRNHRCHKCSRSFYSSNSLQKHIKCHSVKTKKDPFNCFFCEKGFRNERSCQEHIFMHLNEKENVKDFSNIEETGNVSKVAKNSPIMEKCEVKLSRNSPKMKLDSESMDLDCDPVVKRRKNNDDSSEECTIDDVLKSVSESFQYLSENSDFVINDDSIYDEGITDDDGLESTNSSNTNNLEESSSIHKLKETLNLKESVTTVNTRVCRYCNTEFLSSKSFRKHRITECKITECPYCLADFETKNDYENHISVHDGTDKPYICPQCSFCTDSKLNFENHMSVHTGILRFWCLLCDFQAKRINDLMSHTVSDHSEVNIIALYDLLTK